MKRRCSLCGGKLVDNVCVECGLDNSRSDENYTMGRSSCEGEPMTHVHTETSGSYTEKTMTKEARREAREEQKQRERQSKPPVMNSYTMQGQKRKKSGKQKVTGAIAVLVVVVSLAGSLIPKIAEEVRDHKEVQNTSGVPEERAPYEFAKRQLSETGGAYETEFGAGLYKGGVHLPEGSYQVVMAGGEGTLEVRDPENYISLFYSFNNGDMEGTVTEAEDVRIYKGAVVDIDGNVMLRFKTENGQLDFGGILNPNTESRTFDKTFTVGKDIPAGVYDVHWEEGSGIFEYYIKADGYDSYKGKLIGQVDSTFPQELKNIVLPDGVEVKLDHLKVTLTPSEVIESVDYQNFYVD